MSIREKMRTMRSKWHGGIHGELRNLRDAETRSLMAFANHEVMLRDGLDETHSQFYGLHKLFHVMDISSGETLARLGGGSDGGYVMAQPYSTGRIAYSFGIGPDVSWDLAMADAGYEVYQYDHTIERLPCENPHFHWQKVGVSGMETTGSMKPLAMLIRENGHEHETGMVLKMDIEGWEYPVFAHTEDRVLKQFDQIVLELHRVLHWPFEEEMVTSFERLARTHQLVHVHANNSGQVDIYGSLVTPRLLEATFLLKSKYTFTETERIFPTELDRPNSLDRPEIMLGRWNV